MTIPPDEPNSTAWDNLLIARLASESCEFDSTHDDPQRNCWLAVHRYVHGAIPSEYDIREIPESLYLAVLERQMSQQDSASTYDISP